MKTIAIDFDGVIHKYSKGWQDWSIYDIPNKWAFEFIDKLMNKWYAVFIFSTRSPRQIKKWINNHIIEYNKDFDERHMPWIYETFNKYSFTCSIIPFWTKFWNKPNVLWITQRKLPAIAYIDDRAVKFEWNFNILQYNYENSTHI